MAGAKKTTPRAKMLKIGWFSTGRDKAARDLLTVVQDSIRQSEIEADICFVLATESGVKQQRATSSSN